MRLLIGVCLFVAFGAAHADDPACAKYPALAPYVPACADARVLAWADEYFRCAKSHVNSIDDHVSDAGTIAAGVKQLCKNVSPVEKDALGAEAMDAIADLYRPNLIALVLAGRMERAREKRPPGKNM